LELCPHFTKIIEKVNGTMDLLSGIMRNVRGPNQCCRILYSNVIMSILTYGAPVWAQDIRNNKKILSMCNKVTRRIAQRVCCAYKTVSCVAACVIAGIISVDILADRLLTMYNKVIRYRSLGQVMDASQKKQFKDKIKKEAIIKCKDRLISMESHQPGYKVREAITPILEKWMTRGHGSVTFHMTQIITGHGCFNDKILYKINKVDSPICAHCKQSRDTSSHTLVTCKCWETERQGLTKTFGNDLNLKNIVRKIISDPEHWRVFSAFCTRVLTKKEIAERERERGIII